MKKLIFSLILVHTMMLSFAQDDGNTKATSSDIDTTTFVYANVMYEKGNYDASIAIYEQLLQKEGPSAILYYNLGNCYYKIGKNGPCILNYERALMLEPGNDDAAYNLTLANARTRDRMEPLTTSIFLIWWHAIIRIMSAQAWGLVAIIAMWLALAGWAAYLLPALRNYQRPGFFVAIAAFAISIICIAGHFGRKSYDADQNYAIVMAPSSVIKSEPSENSTNLALLHEGFKVQLLQTDTAWSKIEMPDGVIGWIHREEYTEIDPFKVE